MTSKVAAGIVLLGGVLAGVSSLQDMYVAVYNTPPRQGLSYVTSLFGTTSAGQLSTNGLFTEGFAVLLTAGTMVVAVVLTLRPGRVAGPARVATLAAASVFAGVVVAWVVRVLHETELIRAYGVASSSTYDVTYLPGAHLLGLAAVVGVVGAVLVQRPRPVEAPEEDTVVVHRLTEDDTTSAVSVVERGGG
jgi:hypothetical protein